MVASLSPIPACPCVSAHVLHVLTWMPHLALHCYETTFCSRLNVRKICAFNRMCFAGRSDLDVTTTSQ
eukprot:scaffold14521_cov15-Prasinocladus_malaysianus.AAC.1